MWRQQKDGASFREKAVFSLLFLYDRIKSKWIWTCESVTIKFTNMKSQTALCLTVWHRFLSAAGKWAVQLKQRNSDKLLKKKEYYGQWLHILFSVTGSCPFKLLKLPKKEREREVIKKEGGISTDFYESKHVCSDYLLLITQQQTASFMSVSNGCCFFLFACQEHWGSNPYGGFIMPDKLGPTHRKDFVITFPQKNSLFRSLPA